MSRIRIGRDTVLELRFEDYLIIVGAVATAITIYFSLKSDIEQAMRMPQPEVTREYLDSQNEVIKTSLEATQQDICDVKETVNKIESTMQRLDDRIYEMHSRTLTNDYAYEDY